MQPPSGHGKLVILTGWSYQRGSVNKKMTDLICHFSVFGPEQSGRNNKVIVTWLFRTFRGNDK